MFFKKKTSQKQISQPKQDVQVITIPDVFYGGKDPEIYHSSIGNDTKKDNKTVSFPGSHVSKSSKSFLSKKSTWIVGSLIFVIIVAGVAWYYIDGFYKTNEVNRKLPEQTQTQELSPTSSDLLNIPTTTVEVDNVLDEPEIIEMPTTTLDIGGRIQFPLVTLINSADVDSDDLTDVEEEFFGTDSGTWDTDQDGFYDGQEIFNLYNPKGFSPVKLIDSGIVQEYVSPYVGYRVYYPNTWQKGSVDVEGAQVLFSALSGEYIEIRVFKKDSSVDFVTWFGRNAEGQQFTDIVRLTNRFKEEGWRRKDDLVAYFSSDAYVYVFVYHEPERGPIKYRHIMQMMYQSFRMQKSDIDIPQQVLLPGAGATLNTSTLYGVDQISNTTSIDL